MEFCEKMYNVLIMVGMVFVNVFLGICYFIVYKIGGEYGILYGCINVILLLYIICYNVKDLLKYVMFFKYDYFCVDIDYVDIVKFLGLKGNIIVELVEVLVIVVVDLGKLVGIDMNLKV